ncbi:MAG: M1 family metallopeptidase [Actinomycetota bacterium]
MFDYAWRLLKTRRSLWVPAAGCALLAAVPGSLIAIFFALPVMVLVLRGDPVLALELAPGPFDRPAVAVTGAVAMLAVGLAVWSRLYAAAVWASDDRNDPGVLRAFRASRRKWLRVFALYSFVYCVLIAAAAAVAVLIAATADASAVLTLGFVAGSILLIGRVILRVALTLAVRSVVLEGTSPKQSWSKALSVLRHRRREAVAVWVSLVAAGAAVWIGGRLIAPILQDTALDFPSGSGYVAYREIAQLALAVPLEAFLLTLSLGVWTAVYLEREERSRAPVAGARGKRSTDPWVLRALALLVALTVVANGVPTLIEDRLNDRVARQEVAIRAEEIDATDALRTTSAGDRAGRTSYTVDATLVDDRLRWTTDIVYKNETGEVLEDLGINIYPAAYTRDVEDISLAAELARTDVSGAFRSAVRPGTLSVQAVSVDGTLSRFARDETELVIDLPRAIPEGGRVRVEIVLTARLPMFPERFGRWDGTTMLGNWIPAVAVRHSGSWRQDGFPKVGDPFVSEAASYRVSIEADESLSVVGSGVLESVEQSNPDTRIWRFAAAGARDAAFVAAPFLHGLEGRTGSLVVRSWYPAHRALDGRQQLEVAISAATDYQRRFGPLPFDEIDVVATPGFLGGMEYPGVVFISDPATSLAGVPLLPDMYRHAGLEEAGQRYTIGHEVAHQWWYASVGNDQVREPWLDEAFAEVSTRLWLRSVEDDDRVWQMTYLESGAAPRRVVGRGVDTFRSNDEYSDAIYLAGAEVLFDLRRTVGAETFDRILALWHERAQLRIATIDEFIATVEEVAGEEGADLISRYR